MHEIIKPGTKYPFMAMAKYWIGATGALVLLSIILLLTKGLNFGIDFRGGTKMIVAFREGANANADSVKETVRALIAEKTGKSDAQVEVQPFNVGDKDEKGNPVVKFQIYTEVTTLLDDARGKAVEEQIKSALQVETIDRPAETDKFIIMLKSAEPISVAKGKLNDALKTHGYPHVEVSSEEERTIDMEFYKEYNQKIVELQKDGKTVPDDDFDRSLAAHSVDKQRRLETRTDRQFTVSLAQLQTDAELKLFEKFGKENVEVQSVTSVSASVGSDLFSQGMLALIYAIVGILIYIGLRFDFRYSPGVILSLVHDAVFTLGFFSLFNLQFTLPIVSAVLTVIGFSVNDTVVVYDRIRETMLKLKGTPIREIVDRSINETLSRTLLTSLTAILSVLPLIFLGDGFIRDFALALVVGFTVGTYSSIFVASPLVIVLDEWLDHRKKRAQASPPAAANA